MEQFLSPHSLPECVSRLKQLERGDRLRIFSTRVTIRRLDEQTYSYRVSRWEYWNFVAEMSGELTMHDQKTTHVIDQAKTSLHLRLMVVVSLCVCVLGIMSYLIQQRYYLLPLWIIAVGWIAIVWFFWSRWRNGLTNSVKRALS
ncbi:MAG: hypothetical protein H6672_10010 [Anaerolineaceae bacterium]|nr:hypothetical protein [Anaerolineaceae bacterium]